MSDQKIFAGPRIKKFRTAQNLSQTAMAGELEISPSYLNLIERNQRPLTVQILLKLSSRFGFSPDSLQGDIDGLLTQMKQVFSDALLQNELPGFEELFDAVEVAPNVAKGVVKLHQAYRESLTRLSDLNTILAQENKSTAWAQAELPVAGLRRVLEERANYFDILDRRAEELAEQFAVDFDTDMGLWFCLKSWFLQTHRITVQTLPVETMPNWRRRFDKHTRRLFISERLAPFDQLQELASQAATLSMMEAINDEITRLPIKGEEAIRLARIELARYAALALMMPYGQFFARAERMRYDADALATRFGVSFEQVANRLCSMGRGGARGVDFFFTEVDFAGNRVRRAGVNGYPNTSFGGECPKLLIYAAHSARARLLCEHVQGVDGQAYLTLARRLDPQSGGYGLDARPTALMLVCTGEQAARTVYADIMASPPNLVGINCRLCERSGCLARAAAPITRPLSLDGEGVGLSVYDFKD